MKAVTKKEWNELGRIELERLANSLGWEGVTVADGENKIIVTESEVIQWRERKQELNRKLTELHTELDNLTEKLEAVKVLREVNDGTD